MRQITYQGVNETTLRLGFVLLLASGCTGALDDTTFDDTRSVEAAPPSEKPDGGATMGKVPDAGDAHPTDGPSLTTDATRPNTPMPSINAYATGLEVPLQWPDPQTGKKIGVPGATPNNPSDDDGPAIGKAMADAAPGDTVLLRAGTYHIKTRRSIVLHSGVSRRGEAWDTVILDAQFTTVKDNAGSFLIEAPPGTQNVVVSDLTLTSTGGQTFRYGVWLGHEPAAKSGGGGQGYGVMIGYPASKFRRARHPATPQLWLFHHLVRNIKRQIRVPLDSLCGCHDGPRPQRRETPSSTQRKLAHLFC